MSPHPDSSRRWRPIMAPLCALALLWAAAPAHAQDVDAAPLPAQATAQTGIQTHPLFEPSDTALFSARPFQVGVFSPLRWRIDARTELSGHPLAFLVAPNATVRRQLWTSESVSVAAQGALGVPTGLLRLAQTPLWGDQYQIGWIASLEVGAIASWHPSEAPVVVSVHLRELWGPTVVGETDIPHDDVPLIEELVAHITDGPTTIVGLDVDLYALEWLALFADLTVQWSPKSGPYARSTNLDLRGKLMVSVAWTPAVSTSLGLMWLSSQLDRRRLTGFLPLVPTSLPAPLLDVIWRW